MKALKIALVVLVAVVLTPIVLAQGVVMYLVVKDQAAETKAKQVELATVTSAGARDCVSMKHKRPSAWDVGDDNYQQYLRDWLVVCQREAAAIDAAPAVQLSLHEALFASRQRPGALAVLRKLAATDNAEALREIYEQHRSWETDDVNVVPMVSRKEAGEALRRAAELGDADSMARYAVNLDQGSIIKRDIDAAAYWMERTYKNPAKNYTPSDVVLATAMMLTESTAPEKRARGISILEANPNNSRAKAELGRAIRKEDPARARVLFEETLKAWPGISLPPLADMLIKSEGGPADPKRALKLLQSYSNKSAPASINAALGRVYAEGKLLPQDLQKAGELMSGATQWSVSAKIEYANFLADHPTVKPYDATRFTYRLTDIAELGEPGAMEALIALKMSANAAFTDKAGGCKLAERAVTAGDDSAKKFLTGCSVN
jgi:TPR repeat protein